MALAWVSAQPGVTAPIIGARTLAQLEDNLGCVGLALTDDELSRLNAVSALEYIYPYSFIRDFGYER